MRQPRVKAEAGLLTGYEPSDRMVKSLNLAAEIRVREARKALVPPWYQWAVTPVPLIVAHCVTALGNPAVRSGGHLTVMLRPR